MATKTTKSTKRTTTRKAAAQPAPAEQPEAAPVDDAAQPEQTPARMMKKTDLVDRVVAMSNVKKRDAKPAIEAALAILGTALSEGEELNLPPLGKVKVVRTKDAPNAEILVCRVRRPKAAAAAQEAATETA